MYKKLLKTYERFQSFYTNKHQGRKLTWLFDTSKGEVKTNHVKLNNKTPYILMVRIAVPPNHAALLMVC